MLFPSMVMDLIRSSCLDQNFAYSWNHHPLVATMAIGACICAFCAGYEML